MARLAIFFLKLSRVIAFSMVLCVDAFTDHWSWKNGLQKNISAKILVLQPQLSLEWQGVYLLRLLSKKIWFIVLLLLIQINLQTLIASAKPSLDEIP